MDAETRSRARFAAMAFLVTEGVFSRSQGIEALVDHATYQPQPKAIKDAQPRGYNVARAMARQIDQGNSAYSEGEYQVAMAITGGSYNAFEDAQEKAAGLIDLALRRLDALKTKTATELQDAIAGLTGAAAAPKTAEPAGERHRAADPLAQAIHQPQRQQPPRTITGQPRRGL